MPIKPNSYRKDDDTPMEEYLTEEEMSAYKLLDIEEVQDKIDQELKIVHRPNIGHDDALRALELGKLKGKKEILDYFVKKIETCPKCMRDQLKTWVANQSFEVEHSLENKLY